MTGTFSDANRDKEGERRFRWQALERLPGDEVGLRRLRAATARSCAFAARGA
ncbi:MAG: hypothetical protein M3X11_06560 [Acidobacteriota bacterium]|nr:hypothetical protein [Acidobacteriota bacterium]